MSSVYKPEMLETWAEICIKDRAYPQSVEIHIDKHGEYKIKSIMVDGRKLRGRFIIWMASEFKTQTKITPPKNSATKAYAKMWTSPLEALLRQSVYVGGVDYDSLEPREKYSTINAMCFRLLLKDAVTKQREQGLTIASPLSIEKVGTDVASTGNHYRAAVRRLDVESS